MDIHGNPYEAPKAEIDVAEEAVVPVPAGKGLRLLNLLIDYLMRVLLGVAFGVLLVVLGGEEAPARLEKIPDFVLGFIIMIFYYTFMEALFGRTIGKYVTGTRVVGEGGGSASFGQVVGRTFARLIPFEAFSFLGAEARGWHDTMTRTFVVKCR